MKYRRLIFELVVVLGILTLLHYAVTRREVEPKSWVETVSDNDLEKIEFDE